MEEAAKDLSRKVKIGPYVTVELHERAKAVFRQTAQLEGDDSFSEFIATAIVTECRRREELHNAGHRFRGGEKPLPPGARMR